MTWLDFLIFFAIFAESIWFIYYFSLYAFDDKFPIRKFRGKASLIVAVYNEEEKKLVETISSIKNIEGVQEIIFVNDGSTNNSFEVLNRNNDGSYKIVDLKQNVGKRMAQFEGIKIANESSEVIVFIDSDTTLKENSIMELLKPMNDDNIGGVSGRVLVKNEDENIITKSVSTLFWNALVSRKAQSNYGFMQTASGALSCYRASLLKKIAKRYIGQKFMRSKCTKGDDRFLTACVQLDFGKKMYYAENSIAYTYIPTTIKSNYDMFLRWHHGSVRESVLAIPKFKNNPYLVGDIILIRLSSIFQLFIRIWIIMMCISTPYLLFFYLFTMMIITLCYSIYSIETNWKNIPYKLVYSVLNEFIFSWSEFHAWLTIHKQGNWMTR